MGTNVIEEIEKLIDVMKGFNSNDNIVNQTVKHEVIRKLREARLWMSEIHSPPYVPRK